MKRNAENGKSEVLEGFSFQATAIREGDVLLCTDPKSLISRGIRYATNGTFSHAAICSYSPLFIEADFPGVAEFSLARLNLAVRSNARILRLKPSVPNAKELAADAAKAALRYQTVEFDKIAAIRSRLGGSKMNDGIFCSYLVSSAYCASGLNITGDKAKPPAETTPADVENSIFFDDITDQVIRPTVFDPVRGTHYFLDRDPLYAYGTLDVDKNLPSPAQLYNIGLRKVGKQVSDFLKSKGMSPISNYMEAQHCLHQYHHAPWFAELDELFASEFRAHALPVLLENLPIIDEAREINDKWAKQDLAAGLLDYTSYLLVSEDITDRISNTRKLISDRERFIYVFRLGSKNLGWKSMEALAEAEELICSVLKDNLALYERQRQEIDVYPERRGWLTA